MDFEDSGIESDPKINTTEKETLKQHNEPIISFSPERCRFDSAQSSCRKSSFPISVADLQQLDDPQLSNNNSSSNSINNFIQTKDEGAGVTASIQQLKNDHHHAAVNQPLFPNLHNQQHLKQTYPFLHNQPPASSTTLQQNPAAAFVVSTHAISSTTSSSSSSASLLSTISSSASSIIPKNSNRATTLPTKSSVAAADSSSISLMVNGAVLSANNNNNTNSAGSAATTLDLQKRLEKRIAQASAIAAANAAAAASSTTTTETKESNDSIFADIISTSGIANKAINSTCHSSSGGKKCGNQISFDSPQKKSSFFSNNEAEQLDLQEKTMPLSSSSPPASLWESDPLMPPPSSSSDTSAAIDLIWENKAVATPSSSGMDAGGLTSKSQGIHTGISSSINDILDGDGNFEKSGGGDCTIAQLDLTCTSTAAAKTTSCTTVTSTSGGGCVATSTGGGGGVGGSANGNNNIGNVNKSSNSSSSSSSSNKNKSKGNQSLRNNNITNTPTTPTSNAPGGVSSSGAALPSYSSASATVTVVNASFDIRKVGALLPPQRLAIPSKSNSHSQSSQNSATTTASAAAKAKSVGSASSSSAYTNNGKSSAPVHKTSRHGSISETSCSSGGGGGSGDVGIVQPPSGNGNIKTNLSSKLSTDSEKKPLVQWDSDESEEELSFFPPAKRGVITDNLSIDNMSLSGEEEDLHLTPPRPLAKKCPCDPRSWLDRTDLSAGHHHHHGDPTRSIPSKFSCTIS